MNTQHPKHATPTHTGPTGSTTKTTVGGASADNARSPEPVSADEIRLCAYRKWEGAGKPAGDGIRFWLDAEQELMQGK